MLHRLFPLAGLLLAGCIVNVPESHSPSEKSAENSETEPRKLHVSQAKALFAYYDENELRGDRDFKGKLLAVRGTIGEINSDILGTPYVALKTSSPLFCVQCMFKRGTEATLAELEPGRIVTIAGVCCGKFGNVILEDCYFYQETVEADRSSEAPVVKPESKAKAEPEYRTWTDSSGKYVVEAEFLHANMGKVKLRGKDGQTIELPMESLSEADQEWIRKGRYR